ncbi:MAG TPA: carbohydrate kinase family protein [Candidatus Limnocylindrales bacterium]|nr:carbohydrate kinase family protein [Candidatus Limnocylindrales bacterium]
MPRLPRARSGGRRGASGPSPARIVVLGDLMLDVVLAPDRDLASGTDVPGRVSLVQGGSAANTARWLGRLGARTTLIAAVGRDGPGRALVDAVRADGVTVRVSRVAGVRSGRIGVLVAPGGERSFVADRGAADLLHPDHLRAAWFEGADALHLPVYSLLGAPLGLAGRRAIELARAADATISVDLASIGPLLAAGRRAARSLIAGIEPDLLFATAAEAEALTGGRRTGSLLDYASTAVIKRGAKGATVMTRLGAAPSRFEVATERLDAADTTGAGDAFDAGFLVGWFAARSAGRSLAASLQGAALSGHRAAARQLSTRRPELPLG